MPQPLTLAHVLTLAAVLDALVGLAFYMRWSGLRAHGRGTPLYARARDSRRAAALAGGSALALLLLAWATPLGRIPLS